MGTGTHSDGQHRQNGVCSVGEVFVSLSYGIDVRRSGQL